MSRSTGSSLMDLKTDVMQMRSMRRRESQRGAGISLLYEKSPANSSPNYSPLSTAELDVLRAQYEKEDVMVGVQTKFNYAWVSLRSRPCKVSSFCSIDIQGLVKSNTRADQHLGVMLLSEIFRTSPERRRECLYYLALGNYKLGNYAQARRYNDLLLEMEPGNLQSSNLRTLIDDKVAKEGLMGVAIVSGVAVAAGVIGGILLRNLGRKR